MLHADSRFILEANTILLTSYILNESEKQGCDFPFPTYKRIAHNKAGSVDLRGKRYCTLRPMENRINPQQMLKWRYALSFGNSINPCGLNPQVMPDGSSRASADDRCLQGRNDTLLVNISSDWKTLEIFIFNKQGNSEKQLFKRWLAGEAIEVKE